MIINKKLYSFINKFKPGIKFTYKDSEDYFTVKDDDVPLYNKERKIFSIWCNENPISRMIIAENNDIKKRQFRIQNLIIFYDN